MLKRLLRTVFTFHRGNCDLLTKQPSSYTLAEVLKHYERDAHSIKPPQLLQVLKAVGQLIHHSMGIDKDSQTIIRQLVAHSQAQVSCLDNLQFIRSIFPTYHRFEKDTFQKLYEYNRVIYQKVKQQVEIGMNAKELVSLIIELHKHNWETAKFLHKLTTLIQANEQVIKEIPIPLLACMLAGLPFSFNANGTKLFMRLNRDLDVKAIQKKEMAGLLKHLCICYKRSSNLYDPTTSIHVKELINNLYKNIEFLSDEEILLIIEAYTNLKGYYNDLIVLIIQNFIDILQKYEELDMQQAKICLIYLDAFSKLGFHRFKKEDLLTIGQALASFLVKYQAIFKTNHRVEALKNIVTNRLSTQAKALVAEALTQAIFPWSAKLLYYLDHSLFKDMMLRIVPNSFRYARAVYMLCRELDSPPPIIQQYLDQYRLSFEEEIRDCPHNFSSFFECPIHLRGMFDLSHRLIGGLLAADVPDTAQLVQAYGFIITQQGQHLVIRKMMDNKEELRKIYNNIMKLPTKNYFQAKIILCLSKQVGTKFYFTNKLIDRMEEHSRLHPQFTHHAIQYISSYPLKMQSQMTSSVLIKFASSGFVRQAIEMLFESQKDCILANVNQTTIILQMVKSLIFYNLFDRESARVFSVAFKGDSLYNKLLLAKAYPTTPPSMTTVTLNNIKIWVAYPLKTIDKWFSEIVKTIKELTHSRFLELVTFIEPEHFHNELSTALIDYVNPSPNGKLSFEFGCSLLKIFANRGIRQNTFVLFVFEQMAKRFNNLHILDKKKLLNFAIQLQISNQTLRMQLHKIFMEDNKLTQNILSYYNEIELVLSCEQLDYLEKKKKKEFKGEVLAALYLGGREKFVMTKLLEENPSMTARLLYRLLVKGGLRYPELKEEEIGTEESRNAQMSRIGLPFKQLGQDSIERNIFFDPSRTKAVVVLNYIKSYEGQVKGVTARLWRDVAQKVYGASKVAVVSHTSLKNRAHLNQLLASQDLSEYIIEQPQAPQ